MERSKAKADKFRFIDEEKREKVILSLKCIFSCAVGLLLARAKIFGSLSPLGLAFSAAAGSYALAASVGALVGYLLSFSGTAGIRYMACSAVAPVCHRLWTFLYFPHSRKCSVRLHLPHCLRSLPKHRSLLSPQHR